MSLVTSLNLFAGAAAALVGYEAYTRGMLLWTFTLSMFALANLYFVLADTE